MSELRYCPIKYQWTIIAPERRQRPHELVQGPEVTSSDEDDPFLPGRESSTPPTIYSIPRPDNSGAWQVRVFANAFPALRIEGEVLREAVGLNDTVSGIGAHEVIVETPRPDAELADLEVAEVTCVLHAYRARLLDLRRDLRLRYVLIFKNKGRRAGASLSHAHSQLLATPIIPNVVVQELNAARRHFRHRERCLFCDVIRQELRLEERVCLETDRYVALAPFAASSPFETWILPREHRHDFALAADDELQDLAVILRAFLRRLRALLDDPAYNLVLHTAPNPHPRPGRPDFWTTIEYDYHWHLEIVPRITPPGGFEAGAGYSINPTPPEEAARYLRDADPEAE